MLPDQQSITYCLWMDSEAEAAAKLYTSLFEGSSTQNITHYTKEGHDIHGQPEGKVMSVAFTLGNASFMALNGGPVFKMNPTISMFVVSETEEETKKLWSKLIEGGKAMMELGKYDWSPQYGWLQDRFGLSWQLSTGELSDIGQQITPAFMMVNAQTGRAEEAINHYTSIFPNSSTKAVMKHAGDAGIAHAQFTLAGNLFIIMDGGKHAFDFNEGISVMVNCTTQDQIDYYYSKLSEGGEQGPCGWVKDKFGASWQVAPEQLQEMLQDTDKSKVQRVTAAFMKMKKMDIAKLQDAFAGKTKSPA